MLAEAAIMDYWVRFATIARELNVWYGLEGSVRRAGNALRITAQLIDSRTSAHLWADKYSGTTDDVFDLQEKLSRPITDPIAFECYQRANIEIWLASAAGLARAEVLIERALAVVGEHPLLLATAARIQFSSYNFGFDRAESRIATALRGDSGHRHRRDPDGREPREFLDGRGDRRVARSRRPDAFDHRQYDRAQGRQAGPLDGDPGQRPLHHPAAALELPRLRDGANGVRIKPLATYDYHMGSFQMAWRDPGSGLLNSSADPRRAGMAGSL